VGVPIGATGAVVGAITGVGVGAGWQPTSRASTIRNRINWTGSLNNLCL